MPIRSPIGDLGPLGDFLVKIGPPLVPYYTKSPLFRFLNLKKYLNWWVSCLFMNQINVEKWELSVYV